MVNAAPTSRPIPSVEMLFNRLPNHSISDFPYSTCILMAADLPWVAVFDINGKLPTAKLAINMQTHCARRVRSAIPSCGTEVTRYQFRERCNACVRISMRPRELQSEL